MPLDSIETHPQDQLLLPVVNKYISYELNAALSLRYSLPSSLSSFEH